MRKIFLLATTAVFMTTANAWAGTDGITANGQKADINVGVNLQKAAIITDTTDINFGTIYTTESWVDGYSSTIAYFSDGSSNPRCDAGGGTAIACKGTTSAGSYTLSGTPTSISIVGGTNEGRRKDIDLSESKNISVTVFLPTTPAAEGKHYFDAMLTRKANTDLVDGDFGELSGSFTIQLGY